MKNYLDEFLNDGICVIREGISIDTVRDANNSINQFLIKNRRMLSNQGLLPDGMLQRVINLHHSVLALKQVFYEAMECASDVTDIFGRATLYTSLFFEKGSEQDLHRDTPYFYTGMVNKYMGVWVALDDVDENNGALFAVKGSHKLGEPDLDRMKKIYHPAGNVPESSPLLFQAYNQELVRMCETHQLQITVFPVQKGDIIIWHPSTLHGGLPHRDLKRSRRSFVMHITPKNTPVKNMDYFFDRAKYIEPVNKKYEQYRGREIEGGSSIDFMHVKSFEKNELGIY